jgi:HPt (histidine-containing phosphotransfer) domain-containing protein
MEFNLDYLNEISGGDPEFIQEMLNEFVSKTPETIVEVEVTIAQQNHDELYKVIHRFIPTFDFMGASHIISNLRNIETLAKTKGSFEEIVVIFDTVKEQSASLIATLKKEFAL